MNIPQKVLDKMQESQSIESSPATKNHKVTIILGVGAYPPNEKVEIELVQACVGDGWPKPDRSMCIFTGMDFADFLYSKCSSSFLQGVIRGLRELNKI